MSLVLVLLRQGVQCGGDPGHPWGPSRRLGTSPGSARRAAGQASPRDLHWPRLSRLVMDFLQSPRAHGFSATTSGKALPASPVDHTPPGNHRCRCAFAGDYGRVVCLPGCRVGEGRDVLVTCSLYHPAPGGRPWWLSDATLWMLFSFNVGSPQRLRNKRSAVGGERRAALGSFWASAWLFPSRIAYTETPPLLWEDTQVARGALHLGRKTEASSTGWRQLASRGREPAAVQAGPALRPSLQVTAAPNNIFAAVS